MTISVFIIGMEAVYNFKKWLKQHVKKIVKLAL